MPTNVRFSYDATGINPDNLINGEVHALSLHSVRAVAPVYGPFFSTSVQVFDNGTDQILTRGVDYQLVEMLEDITLRLGKEVCNLILILNTNVSSNVRLNYQVVGGMYQNDASSLINMYETVLLDNRPVAWENVLSKPLAFPPTTHLHNLQDVYGFEPLVGALERVRNAIVLSDIPAFEALIDWVSGLTADTNVTVNNMTSAITIITSDLSSETAARIAGDNAESAARIAGDNAESAARIAGDAALQTAVNGKQNNLGFTPVQQGTGVGQGTNVVKIGWSSGGRLKATVDVTDLGNLVFDSQLGAYLPLTGGSLSGSLSVTGSVTATGDVYAYSDPRLKDNIINIDNALELCDQLDGVFFTWNNASKFNLDKVGKRDVGILANQVKAILPEIVSVSHDDENNIDYDVVAYSKLVPLLLEAIKSLNSKVKILESKV